MKSAQTLKEENILMRQLLRDILAGKAGNEEIRATIAEVDGRVKNQGFANPKLRQKLKTLSQEKKARNRETYLPMLQRLQKEGLSHRKIAAELNRQGVMTPTGRPWAAGSVNNILKDA